MTHLFSSLALRPELIEGVALMGFEALTDIQAAALPPMLEGKDVTGQAATGSGKTAAFGLGLLQQLDTTQRHTQALVLVPTRELAEQVATELRSLAARVENTRVVTVVGGRPMRGQNLALERGAHIVVGTPGRVGKHLSTGMLRLEDLRVLVLDEADRMLDMGFEEEVTAVVSQCPERRQTLLFSATFPDGIQTLAGRVQTDAVTIKVDTEVDRSQLQQQVLRCDPELRWQKVIDILGAEQPASALVFCETINDVEQLTTILHHKGASAEALHGKLEQRRRDDVLLQLTNGSIRVLVATDLAARGLDIDKLPLVIVAELSPDPEVHVHRIGRTGRAESSGRAITLVCGDDEEARLEAVVERLGVPEDYPEPPRCRELSALTAEMQTLVLLAGRKHKVRKGDVLGALVKDAGLPASAIGAIDLMPTQCAVAIQRQHARKAHRWLETGRIKRLTVRSLLLD